VIERPSFWCAGLRTVGIPLVAASISFGQETGSTSQEANPTVPVVMEVIVTGSNIPTAEEIRRKRLGRIQWTRTGRQTLRS